MFDIFDGFFVHWLLKKNLSSKMDFASEKGLIPVSSPKKVCKCQDFQAAPFGSRKILSVNQMKGQILLSHLPWLFNFGHFLKMALK
jgi:hypothetical protein